MTEQLISLETAKLAKEKGFSNGSENYYNLKIGDLRTVGQGKSGFAVGSRADNKNNIYAIAEAPTQSLLQKWLREKHNLYVNANPVIYAGDEKASYFQSSLNTNIILYRERFDTYEDALEASLKYALTLIK
jgi:hypothetical protein